MTSGKPHAARVLKIKTDAPIPTWFKVGGRADRYAEPASADQLAECLRLDPHLRVLGDGANLLVADEGVGELVVRLAGAFRSVEIDAGTGFVRAGAGASLSKLIHETVQSGLAGLETIIGVPATVGGAAVMNAGGAHGEIADSIARVHAMDRAGASVVLERDDIGFGYRRSGVGGTGGLIITAVDFDLQPCGSAEPRQRLLDIMASKKQSQPLRAKTCGCVFKNPTLTHTIDGIGEAGSRVGAGLLIDRAGGKGLTRGCCRVSDVHANFVETGRGATATDILHLIDDTRALVQQRFGVTLHTEVIIWGRS